MIQGSYFNGETSEKQDVALYYSDDGQISFDVTKIGYFNFDAIKISSRIGNSPRYINFPDGSQFETENNDAVDRMVKSLSKDSFHGLAHKLESAKTFVFITIVAVILFGWAFVQHGIPFFSKEIAEILPNKASQYMGQGVLEAMDKSWFEKSTLSAEKQNELRAIFQELLKNIDDSEHYKLEFRLGGKIQANAFALPNGTIVFTDELINLAENNLEIASIMLHEIGHLKHRHSIRSTIQQFSLAMFVMVVTGDVSTSSSIVTAIPIMLVESGFSQGMETEADTYSLEYMSKHRIDPKYFSIIMEKLEASYLPEYSECKDKAKGIKEKLNCIKDAVVLNKSKQSSEDILNYFSTHPTSQERIERFRTPQ